MKYFISVNGQQQGPFEEYELMSQGLTPSTLVWKEGMASWAPASTLPELAAYITSAPVGGYAAPAVPAGGYAAPVGGYAAPAYVQPPVQQPTGPMPKTYLAESIGIMLCCCQIFGIIGLVHASGVSSAYNAGRYSEAEQKSQDAKKWVKYGLIAGVVQYLLLGIFYFVYFFILIGAAASGY